MSKKKNKNKKNSYFSYSSKKSQEEKTKKGKKGKRGSVYEEPKLKAIKPTLDKKAARENEKAITKKLDVPKGILKSREICNHAGELISVEEFKSLNPGYAAITPMLEPMIEAFGEDHIAVCRRCFDVVVDGHEISTGDIEHAVAILYATVNTILCHKRLGNKELEKLTKTRGLLERWNEVVETYSKLESKGAFAGTSNAPTKANPKEYTSKELAEISKKLNGTPATVL